jgi:flagellar biosynthesis GTPase FlhF
MATRKAPTPLSATTVERLLRKDNEKVVARREARKAEKAQTKAEKAVAKAKAEAEAKIHEAERAETNKARNLAAVQAEAAATGMSFEEAAASMGVDPTTGDVLDPGQTSRTPRVPYSGPMSVLKQARLTYTKASNGILCNGDKLAMLCGQFERPVVVAGLIAALDLPGNPYLHLNPGQQSMNLRNKARRAISEGILSLAKVEACLRAVK